MQVSEESGITLVEQFNSWLSSSYDIICPNCHYSGSSEADLLMIRTSGLVDEIEVKITRSDYLADCKKIVYTGYEAGIGVISESKLELMASGKLLPNYFWYAVKKGEVSLLDIPAFAGFIELDFDNERIEVIRKPKRLHIEKASSEFIIKTLKKFMYRYWDLRNKLKEK